jgi:hypothetical protein
LQGTPAEMPAAFRATALRTTPSDATAIAGSEPQANKAADFATRDLLRIIYNTP